jgi:hypothetical protein
MVTWLKAFYFIILSNKQHSPFVEVDWVHLRTGIQPCSKVVGVSIGLCTIHVRVEVHEPNMPVDNVFVRTGLICRTG